AIESLDKDYMYFYNKALASRKTANYPPYVNMSQIIVSGIGYLKTYQESYMLKNRLENSGFNTLGPTQALILKRGSEYRFKLTIKHNQDEVNQIIKILKENNGENIRVIFTPFIDLE
ncbi:MAG: hypothetical protein GX546_04550, partial [Acholeplasmataceae bacterium]|nr:hypothetical protein [Acholeplasmataceae bacterium]